MIDPVDPEPYCISVFRMALLSSGIPVPDGRGSRMFKGFPDRKAMADHLREIARNLSSAADEIERR